MEKRVKRQRIYSPSVMNIAKDFGVSYKEALYAIHDAKNMLFDSRSLIDRVESILVKRNKLILK